MSLSSPFIARPRGTSLLALALVLAGIVAYQHLSVAPLPRVDFPAIFVSAALPGAGPETMASAVATPLERRFGRIAGLNEITSSSNTGMSQIVLQFDLDRDIDGAARDVQAAINAAGGDLPANLPTRPSYRKVNPADSPILILAMTSQTLAIGALYDVANTLVAPRISQVDGVGQVSIAGAQQPAVRVQVDPVALAGRGLTLADLRVAIGQASVAQATGSLQGETQAITLDVDDQLRRPEDYADLRIAPQRDPSLRLRDVAQVHLGQENSHQVAWRDDARAVVLVVRRQPDANIIKTIERVHHILPTLRRSISPAIGLDVAVDRAATIRASVQDVEFSLVLSILLVVAVVYLFLRSPTATCIPSVAVPLSLLGTFAGMVLLDYSLNNLTLMALTIATGFVVDDAIVVTENIMRHIEAGTPPRQAALLGARQIGFTIVSITASLIAVFLPVLLMGGIVGRLFREFSVTLVLAILISAVVSLTLTPSMCAALLRRSTPKAAASSADLGAFARLTQLYARGLHWALARRRTMLALNLVTVLGTVALFVTIPKGMFPQQDTGLLIGFSEAPQDISFVAMEARQRQLQDIVRADPDVDHVVSFMGSSSGPSNIGFFFIGLRPHHARRHDAQAIIGRLRSQLARVDGITLYLQAAQDMRMGGRSSRTQFQYTLQDADLQQLKDWAPRVLAQLQRLPELRDVASDEQMGGLTAFMHIDRDAAARLGLTPKRIDDALYDAYGQRMVATIYSETNQNRVILEVQPQFMRGLDDLGQIYVGSGGGSGPPVALSQVTQLSTRQSSLAINHQSQFAAVTLSFNLAPNVALGAATAAVDRSVASMSLPPGLHAGFAGTARAFAPNSAGQPLLVLAALATVYIVLGVLYESTWHPLTILSTLPSAGLGALLALRAANMEFGIIALIGIILLIGIVKKNAIMMVDFALDARRERGLGAEAAIYEACLLRFRPIMMTTLAALIGALPLALGQGAGAEMRRPLGVAIVGGLLVSQALTLFTTPVVYLALTALAERGRKARRSRQAGRSRLAPARVAQPILSSSAARCRHWGVAARAPPAGSAWASAPRSRPGCAWGSPCRSTARCCERRTPRHGSSARWPCPWPGPGRCGRCGARSPQGRWRCRS